MSALRNGRGFTLVELLVAAGITAFLASLMVAIIASAAELWRRSAERLHGEAIARVLFAQIETDLAAAVRRDGSISAEIVSDAARLPSTIWETGSHAKPEGSISLRESAALADSRFGVGGVWLRFVTTRAAQNHDVESISAPVAVAYRIAHRKRFPAEPTARYVLCRSEVRPGSSGATARGTLEVGYDLDATGYIVEVPAAPGDPGTLALPFFDSTDSSVVAEGVIDFGLRGYVLDPSHPDGLRQILPDNDGSNGTQPDIVDVMVRILTDSGVQRMARFESGPGTVDITGDGWWALAEANSHIFTRRIAVVASSP